MKSETYAELIRKAMRAKGMNRRDVEKAIGYSYEHIRKIVSGLPLMSEDFNEKVCKVLGLDAAEMWAVATREKMKRAYGTAGLVNAPDNQLRQLWTELTTADQERVVKIIEGMAEQRRAERAERDTDDPQKIREKIIELTNRLGQVRNAPDLSQRRSAR